MQINKINSVYSDNTKKNKRNIQSENNNISTSQNNPAFKGAGILGAGIDKFSLFIADKIENGGLFVSFTLQDMLGTNLPRPFMGLMRNSKENNGEKNTKFALKELTREMITGPSMFIIPAMLFEPGKKLFGSATNVPMKFIKEFGKIHSGTPLDEAGNIIGKQDFYKNTFAEIIKNAKQESVLSQETKDKASDFAKRLASVKEKKPMQELIGNMTNEFTDIVKNHAQDAAHTDFTGAVISDNLKAPFSETVNHMVSYANDIVPKVKKKATADNAKNYISKMTNKKIIGRFAANVGIYAAVLGFLQIIPKLYNKAEGDKNAGLKGLMKEETFNSDKPKETKNKSGKTANNKSNPSFGSAASFVNKVTGSGIIGKAAQALEFEGINLSFPMLLGVMSGGIILPRTRQAKDEYDKSEILRRDITTCLTMCFAEKELRKGFSKLNENKTGFVLSAKDKGFKEQSLGKRFFDYIRPINGVKILSTDQIVSKYSGIDKYKDGIKGFCDFVDGQGGNLSKIFSLTDESKSIVGNILQKEGKDLGKADNSVIKDALTKAKNSEEVNKLISLFKEKDNPWVKKAKTINARFTAFSVCVLVPVFLGFMMPWINAKSTKKRISKENEAANKNINNINDSVNRLKNTKYVFEHEKVPSVFSEINNIANKK